MTEIDPRELRNALGVFLTGVTVVSTCQQDGTPRGFTANSFTSVSLEPPLVLICVAKAAESLAVFETADGFAINVLAEDQRNVSGAFASKRPDKFSSIDWRPGPAGHPILDGVAAWFDCVTDKTVDAGDHIVLLGRVVGFDHSAANPLGYTRGAYFSLGLAHDAVDAAGGGVNTRVGAIVERDGAVLLLPDTRKAGGVRLPAGDRYGSSGDATSLIGALAALGIEAEIGFLYAVFEDSKSGAQSIYYRGEATGGDPAEGSFTPFDDIPWPLLPDDAMRSMLHRYVEEREQDTFGVYVGNAEAGEVHPLGKT